MMQNGRKRKREARRKRKEARKGKKKRMEEGAKRDGSRVLPHTAAQD